MMGSEGSVVQARGAWCSEPSGVRSTGIVTDLTAPVVRAAVARQAMDRPARPSATPLWRPRTNLRSRIPHLSPRCDA